MISTDGFLGKGCRLLHPKKASNQNNALPAHPLWQLIGLKVNFGPRRRSEMGAEAADVVSILKPNKTSSAKTCKQNICVYTLNKIAVCGWGPAEARPKFPTVDKLMVNKQNPSLLYFQFTWRGAIMDPSAWWEQLWSQTKKQLHGAGHK